MPRDPVFVQQFRWALETLSVYNSYCGAVRHRCILLPTQINLIGYVRSPAHRPLAAAVSTRGRKVLEGAIMRKTSLLVAALGAFLLLPAIGAFACTNLATLNLSEASVSAGDTIDVTGTAFSSMGQEVPGEGGDSAEAVMLRWDAVDGEVLAEIEPSELGTIQGSVTVPEDAEAGSHVLVATQQVVADAEEDDVRPAYGTPARAAISVDAPMVEAREIGTPPVTTAASFGAEPGLLTFGGMALLGLLGLALFGAGLGLFVRDARRRPDRVTLPVGTHRQ